MATPGENELIIIFLMTGFTGGFVLGAATMAVITWIFQGAPI